VRRSGTGPVPGPHRRSPPLSSLAIYAHPGIYYPRMDLILENARIVDGTGSPWFHGHVGVEDSRIVRIGRGTPPDASTGERVNLDDNVPCPGFIDAHSHSDLQPFADPTLEPKLRQGVTTEILG